MNILGISAFGENPAACLVQDGVLRAFSQEERFTRLKISAGHFPSNAVGWCLQSHGLRLADISAIAVSWDCTKYPWQMFRFLTGVQMRLPRRQESERSSLTHPNGFSSAWRYLLDHTPATFEQGIRDHLRDAGHKGAIPKICFIPHHLSHAFQAFHQSPFDEAAVLVADGSGEENTVSGYRFSRNEWKRVFHIDVPQSLGWYYGGFTAYLGFHANRDEGKLMGLAALGESRRTVNPWLERLGRVIRVHDTGFEIDPCFFKFSGNEFHPRFSDALRRFIVGHAPALEPVSIGEQANTGGASKPKYLLPEYIDLAFAVQDRLEAALMALVRRLTRETGLRRLCYAGGVAMNCKANGRLLQEAGIDEIFVHPASSDDGAAIGAAFVACSQHDRLLPNPLRHAQLGPAYTNEDIRRALDSCGAPYQSPSDVAVATADLLAEGQIVGWFQGGMEMGARALGGRSIIASPQGTDTRTRVNRRVKYREEWRPYCPSVTAEAADRYMIDPVEAPFMILARKATHLLAERGPATVHVDGTIRPQTVAADVLPLWHHLLCCAGERTGDPVLLNTSFNRTIQLHQREGRHGHDQQRITDRKWHAGRFGPAVDVVMNREDTRIVCKTEFRQDFMSPARPLCD